MHDDIQSAIAYSIMKHQRRPNQRCEHFLLRFQVEDSYADDRLHLKCHKSHCFVSESRHVKILSYVAVPDQVWVNTALTRLNLEAQSLLRRTSTVEQDHILSEAMLNMKIDFGWIYFSPNIKPKSFFRRCRIERLFKWIRDAANGSIMNKINIKSTWVFIAARD